MGMFFDTDDKSTIPDSWMNDPFFTGSDSPIPDDWYTDPFYNDDNTIPRDTDKPSNDDLIELEPWDDAQPDTESKDSNKDKDNSKSSSKPKQEAKSKPSDDLLMSVEKWLDLGVKEAGKVADIVRGDKAKSPTGKPATSKIKTFDDVKVNVPTEMKPPTSAITVYGRYLGLDQSGQRSVAQKIVDRGDTKDSAWMKADISGVKASDILLQAGFSDLAVFNQYLNLDLEQRRTFLRLVDDTHSSFAIDIDPHAAALDSVHAALSGQE